MTKQSNTYAFWREKGTYGAANATTIPEPKMCDIWDNETLPLITDDGFNNFRYFNYIGTSDITILEAYFQMGVLK